MIFQGELHTWVNTALKNILAHELCCILNKVFNFYLDLEDNRILLHCLLHQSDEIHHFHIVKFIFIGKNDI